MLVSTLIAAIGLASSTRAWGGLGHKTAANVALQFLPENVVSILNAILAADGHRKFPNPTIVDIASWADDFGNTPSGNFSKGYHYINAQDNPPFECGVDLRRDCSGAGECVVKAIANYTERLVAPDGNPDHMADALKFLVHFVADVTQPLHAEAIARGGNNITVKWNGNQAKLHVVWDTDMITKLAGPDDDESLKTWTDTIYTEITRRMYQKRLPQWLSCTDIHDALNCATEWASEANTFVCSYVLATDPTGKELSGNYYRGATPIIQEQIAKSGARLAVLLNQIFGAGQPGKLPLAAERLIVQGRDV